MFVKLTFVVNKVSDEKDVSVFMKKETVDTSLYIKHCYIQFCRKCVFHVLKKSFAPRFHPFQPQIRCPSDIKGFKQCSFNVRLRRLIALYSKHPCYLFLKIRIQITNENHIQCLLDHYIQETHCSKCIKLQPRVAGK